MTKKIRLSRTIVYEYVGEPENYPTGTDDIHKMMLSDIQDINTGKFGPEELGDDEPQTTDKWEIFDDNA